MNEDTLISVHCYAGDADLVRRALPMYHHHQCPVIILSPVDSPVRILSEVCLHGGKRAYIGQDSLDRQLTHCRMLLETPYEFFLLHDADSFCVSPEIPRLLYEQCEDTVWSNEVTEPRPHASPYPKIAMQPSYWMNRRSLEKIVAVMPKIPAHEITPYIDWWMLAATCEAGLEHRAFTETEHAPRTAAVAPSDPWDTLAYRIEHMGAVFMHPIKTAEQLKLCIDARQRYKG